MDNPMDRLRLPTGCSQGYLPQNQLRSSTHAISPVVALVVVQLRSAIEFICNSEARVGRTMWLRFALGYNFFHTVS